VHTIQTREWENYLGLVKSRWGERSKVTLFVLQKKEHGKIWIIYHYTFIN